MCSRESSTQDSYISKDSSGNTQQRLPALPIWTNSGRYQCIDNIAELIGVRYVKVKPRSIYASVFWNSRKEDSASGRNPNYKFSH